MDNTLNTNEEVKKEKSISDEQQEVLKSIGVPRNLKIEIMQPKRTIEVAEMNNTFDLVSKIYKDVLSPQLEKNEELKRQHKSSLMYNIFSLLKVQFIFTYIFVFILLVGILASKRLGISEHTIDSIIKFIEFYITSIVVELISILFFIVKNVFDKSIVDLIKNFDKQDKNKKSEEQEN